MKSTGSGLVQTLKLRIQFPVFETANVLIPQRNWSETLLPIKAPNNEKLMLLANEGGFSVVVWNHYSRGQRLYSMSPK